MKRTSNPIIPYIHSGHDGPKSIGEIFGRDDPIAALLLRHPIDPMCDGECLEVDLVVYGFD